MSVKAPAGLSRGSREATSSSNLASSTEHGGAQTEDRSLRLGHVYDRGFIFLVFLGFLLGRLLGVFRCLLLSRNCGNTPHHPLNMPLHDTGQVSNGTLPLMLDSCQNTTKQQTRLSKRI